MGTLVRRSAVSGSAGLENGIGTKQRGDGGEQGERNKDAVVDLRDEIPRMSGAAILGGDQTAKAVRTRLAGIAGGRIDSEWRLVACDVNAQQANPEGEQSEPVEDEVGDTRHCWIIGWTEDLANYFPGGHC